MMQRRHDTTGPKDLRPLARAAAIAFATVALAACSSVPSWVNPVKAYDSVFGSSPSPAPASRTQTAQRGGSPNLSSVPARPQTSSTAERSQATQGLVADRGNARYTDDIVRSDDEGGVPLPPRPGQPPVPVQVARAAPPPAPSAVPPLTSGRDQAPPSTSLRDTPSTMPATPREAVSAVPAPPPPPPVVTAQAAPAADPLADRRVTPSPAPSVASAADPLADRRVTPQPRPASASDALEARRTITQPRVAPVPQAVPPAIPPAVERVPVAPPAVAAQPMAPAPQMVQAPIATPAPVMALPPPVLVATVAPQPLPAPVAPPPALRDERDASFALRGAANVRAPAAQDAFAATFNSMIAQSAATVTTAPANAAFMPSAAQPILANQTMAPPLAQMAYNQSLGTAPAVLPAPGMQMAAGGMALPGFASPGREPAAVVRFANGSSSVPGEYRTALRRVAEEYRSRGGAVRVVGHASGRAGGSAASEKLVNFKVSQDRAQSVANELIRLGVSPQAIFTEAVADSDPLYDESNPRGEAENRRAEIYLDF